MKNTCPMKIYHREMRQSCQGRKTDKRDRSFRFWNKCRFVMFFSALSGSVPDPRKYKQPDVVTTDGISWTDRMTRKTCFSLRDILGHF